VARETELLLHHLDRARPQPRALDLARQTANKLKSSSQNGCSTEDAERAQVSRCDPHNRRFERVPVQEKT
jgi:hypothetical protein